MVCVCVHGVCIGNAHTRTLSVCALPIHARAYTMHTHTMCVCVVYVRVCIGGAQTHNVRMCALPIHTSAYTTHTHTCVRGVYIGNEHTHKVRVCALPIHTRAYTTHRLHVCVRGVIRVCICIAHTRTMYVCVLFRPNADETIIHHTNRDAERTNYRQTPYSISDF